MFHKTLSYKREDFSLRVFLKDFKNILVSENFGFKVGFTYYLSITNINGKILGSVDQIPFILVNYYYINQLTVDLYSKIYENIDNHDWMLEELFVSSFFPEEIESYDILFIHINSKYTEKNKLIKALIAQR
jgi:hypothetical protein